MNAELRMLEYRHSIDSSETIVVFIKKEFSHVLRDRKTLLILFGMPVVQILIFGFALTNEVKDSNILIINQAKGPGIATAYFEIRASKYFHIEKIAQDNREIDWALKRGKTKLAIILPANFNSDLLHQNKAQVRVIADASDPNHATTLINYVTAIISQDYQDRITNNAGCRIRSTWKRRCCIIPS